MADGGVNLEFGILEVDPVRGRYDEPYLHIPHVDIVQSNSCSHTHTYTS